MEKVMALLAQGFFEEILVNSDDFLVLVRELDLLVTVDGVKLLHTLADRLLVRAERLAAAGDASAGTGHDFDEMNVLPAGADFLEKLARVTEAGRTFISSKS